jgi:hypothetical protein
MSFTCFLFFVIFINITKATQKSMTDLQIIFKHLNRHYPDDHVVTYLYISGDFLNKNMAIRRIFFDTNLIFGLPEETLKSYIKEFLDEKNYRYLNRKLVPKPLY